MVALGTIDAKYDRILSSSEPNHVNPIGVQMSDKQIFLTQGDNIVCLSKEMVKELKDMVD